MTESRPRRTAWDDLDTLALEEEQALRAETAAPPPPPVPASPFASDEEFLVRALAHLAGHAAPAALLARLSEGFAPQPAPAAVATPAPPDEPERRP